MNMAQYNMQIPQINERENRDSRSVQFNESRSQSDYAPEITFDRESNQANTHEQQALRRWLHNKYYDGDKNYASTDELINAIHGYQNSQHTHDSVILRNVAQSFTKLPLGGEEITDLFRQSKHWSSALELALIRKRRTIAP